MIAALDRQASKLRAVARLLVDRYQLFLVAVVAVAFAATAAVGFLTYPVYYEDETWSYLSVFEALRGNGFTWAALGEGHALLGAFDALMLPLVWLSPFRPEETVRVISMVAALGVLSGAYALARRLAPSEAWLAPLVIFATPFLFTAMRYGRSDVVALAFAMWCVACAAWRRPLLAGVFSGLAVSGHPMYVWLAAPCLVFALDAGRRDGLKYVAGGLLGIAPQLVWTLLYWDDASQIVERYAVSSSLGSQAAAGILSSVWHEPQRYDAYFDYLRGWRAVLQAGTYVGLPALALWFSLRSRRPELASLVLAPVIGLALLVQMKNPYYLHVPLAFLAVVAAAGATRLPAGPVLLTGIIVLAVTAWSDVSDARRSHDALSARDIVPELAERLPKDAVVVSPILFGGLIRERPDLRFFSYHALSTRPGWGLPACDVTPAKLRSLIESDPRRSSRRVTSPAAEAHFVTLGSHFLPYLRAIYTKADSEVLRCLLAAPGGETVQVSVCRAGGRRCREIRIATMPLDAAAPSSAPGACPCSLWPPGTRPLVEAFPDAGSYEIGVLFRSEGAGSITSIRFYKGTVDSGPLTAHLWSSSGALLAMSTSPGNARKGWQELPFGMKVPIERNTDYVASYSVPHGRFAWDEAFFASKGVDRAPLHAPGAGLNGVYAPGAGNFPSLASGNNYWVDVIFVPAP